MDISDWMIAGLDVIGRGIIGLDYIGLGLSDWNQLTSKWITDMDLIIIKIN